MKVVIPGGTGFLGTALAEHCTERGDDVIVLSRNPRNGKPWKEIHWGGKTLGDWQNAINGSDLVVNLAGRSVNCRYNHKNKEEIYQSRLESTIGGRRSNRSRRRKTETVDQLQHRNDLSSRRRSPDG